MLEIHERLARTDAQDTGPAEMTLTLTFDARQRSRQRVVLDDGGERALLLPRGTTLRDGDRLRDAEGTIVRVCAAPETVSVAHTADRHRLVRAAYHLGNRHVPLQIDADSLRYRHDHVLDAMVAGLGLSVSCEQAPFEPEPGAYAHEGHGHAHHGGHDG
jgi:urease accessory protein